MGQRSDIALRLGEYCEDAAEIGLSFRCKNCCEEYSLKEETKDNAFSTYNTKISKTEYFETLEQVCGHTITNIIWKIKKMLKPFT